MNNSFVGKRDWKNMFDGARKHHKKRLHKQTRHEGRVIVQSQYNGWQEDKATDEALAEIYRNQMACIAEIERLDREFYGI